MLLQDLYFPKREILCMYVMNLCNRTCHRPTLLMPRTGSVPIFRHVQQARRMFREQMQPQYFSCHMPLGQFTACSRSPSRIGRRLHGSWQRTSPSGSCCLELSTNSPSVLPSLALSLGEEIWFVRSTVQYIIANHVYCAHHNAPPR